jgi:hypothetical protein
MISNETALGTNGFFPLPREYLVVPPYLHLKSRRARVRMHARRGIALAAICMIDALNCLALGEEALLNMNTRNKNIAPTLVQRASIDSVIVASCRRAWRAGDLKYEDPSAASPPTEFAYAQPKTTAQNIRVDDLALPAGGIAASVPLEPLLPDTIRPYFESADAGLVLGEASEERELYHTLAAAVRYTRGWASEQEYARIIVRLWGANMLRLSLLPALVTNGMFAVPKPSHDNADRQRLIADDRPGNTMFGVPWSIQLPNCSTFSNLVLDPGTRLYAAKIDVDSFYHRFKVPAWLEEYQGLPPVDGDLLADAIDECVSAGLIRPFSLANLGSGRSMLAPGIETSMQGSDSVPDLACLRGKVWHPRAQSLLMGWTGSVHTAQAIFEKIVTSSAADATPLISGDTPRTVGEVPTEAVYIDDFICLGTDPDRVNERKDQVITEVRACGLEESGGKTVTAAPGQRTVDILGCQLRDGMMFGPSHLAALLSDTRRLLAAKWVSGKSLESLVGRWTWAMLCNRVFFCIFEHTYRYVRYFSLKKRPGKLWSTVRTELQNASALAPLLYVHLDAPFHPRVYATDASEGGGGMCDTSAPPTSELLSFLQSALPVVGDREAATAVRDFAQQHQWRWITSHPWAHPDRINRLEFAEALTACRRALRRPEDFGKRITLLCDSTVVVGCLRKGRSSVHRLNTYCRRVAAHLLASNSRLYTVWIPTEVNPADAPSRAASLWQQSWRERRSRRARSTVIGVQ